MSDKFNPTSWAAPVEDLVKEYNTWDHDQHSPEPVQEKPEEFSKSIIRRGLMNPSTGMPIHNSKQGTILAQNIMGFSEQGKVNYESIFGHC